MRGVSVLCVACALAACERPPVGDPPGNKPPPSADRVGPVAFDIFVQDRNAIAGKWYDYDPSNHSVAPKQQAWFVDTGTGAIAAFRIVSGYDPNTASLGVFTLAIAYYDLASTTWSSESTFTASKNIQTDGDDCVDLTTPTEVDCASSSWQLRLSSFQYFAPSAGITISDPGIFLRSLDGTPEFGTVRVARVDNVTDLSQLPTPPTGATLPDGSPPTFASTDWDFTKFATDLPRAGMAFGSLSRVVETEGDVWWIMTSRFSLIRTTIGVPSPGTGKLAFRFSAVDVNRTDNSAPKDMPAPTDATVDVPDVGKATFVSFANPDLSVSADDLVGTKWPYSTPKNKAWDLAIEQPSDGDVRILLSPDVAVIDATQLGLDETSPPTDTTNTP